MKRSIYRTALWLVLMFVSSLVFAQSELDFTLVNETGFDIYSVYLSPSESSEWGDDVLDMDILENNNSVEIQFSPFEDAEFWDLKAVDEDGAEVVWEGIEPAVILQITISMEEGEPVANIESIDDYM